MTPTAFMDYTMFCSSTGNQTINLIPVLQLGIKDAVLFSTDYTESRGLTDRLLREMAEHGINGKSVRISPAQEKSVDLLSKCLLSEAEPHDKVVWNISGGQKIPTLAFYEASSQRTGPGRTQDVVLYMEANPPELWYWPQNDKTNPVTERTNVPLMLATVLYLYGYQAVEATRIYPEPYGAVAEQLDVGEKAAGHFLSDPHFREAFFRYMVPDEGFARSHADIVDLTKKGLRAVEPRLQDLHVTKAGYENLETNLASLVKAIKNAGSCDDVKHAVNNLRLLALPEQLYEDYWNSIKRATVEEVLSRIEGNDTLLVQGPLSRRERASLAQKIADIGGIVKPVYGPQLQRSEVPSFSIFPANGILFEWMIAGMIADAIHCNTALGNAVSEAYINVKTKKLDDKKAEFDAEMDLVIVSRFGTLIILEMKTHQISGDTAEKKENTANKKSGPYGKAIIVGPVTTQMVTQKNGSEKYPSYVDGKTAAQKATAEQHGVEYAYLDEVVATISRKLYAKEIGWI